MERIEELRAQLVLLHSLANDTTENNWRDKRLYVLQTCVRMSDALSALEAEGGTRQQIEVTDEMVYIYKVAFGEYLHTTAESPNISFNATKHALSKVLSTPPAIEEQPASGWRSMDSAPKDGTKILIHLYEGGLGEIVVARWYAPWGNWQVGVLPYDPAREEYYGIGSLVPVAWMPPPPLPRAKDPSHEPE